MQLQGAAVEVWRKGDALPPARPGGRDSRFRADVQGLRAVAVLAVVGYHAGLPGVSGGYVGVDVFYVLSGFLITGLLWRELDRTGGVDLAAFYARRIRRLLPAAAVVLVATAAASLALLPPLRSRQVLTDTLSAALYVSNYRFAWLRTDYLASTAGPSPVQHFWSLSVEEQFYLLWPGLLWLAVWAGRHRLAGQRRLALPAVLAVTAGSFALSLVLTTADQPWAFFSLPTRAWELGAGAALALGAPALRRIPRLAAVLAGWSGLVAVLVAALAFTEQTSFPGTAALLPVLGAAAVLAAGTAVPGVGVARFLSHRPLQRVGAWSYAWYLWHWPGFVLAPVALGRPQGLPLPARLLLAGLSAGLAAATVRLVENPVRFSGRLSAQPRRGLALGGAVTAATVLAVSLVPVALPPLRGSRAVAATAPLRLRLAGALTGPRHVDRASPLLDAVTRAVAAGLAETSVPRNLVPALDRAHADKAAPFVDGCHLSWTDVHHSACAYADARSPVRVALFGDSHATQWFPALDAVARERNWRLESLTKATCPPVLMDLWSPALGHDYWQCTQWREAVLARLRAERPALVVLGMARHYGPEYRFSVYGPGWLAGLHAMVAAVRSAGVPVLVIGPTPHPPGDVPECLSAHLQDVSACTFRRAAAVDPAGIAAERAATTAAGGHYLDVTAWACGVTRCPVVVGNLLVYRDDNHLTTAYPRWLAPLLAERLVPLLPAARGNPVDTGATTGG